MEPESCQDPVLRGLDHFQICFLQFIVKCIYCIFLTEADGLSFRIDEVKLCIYLFDRVTAARDAALFDSELSNTFL